MPNKYLEKIAKEYHTTTEVPDTRISSALGGAVVGTVTAHQVNSRVGDILQRKIALPMMDQDPKIDGKIMEKVLKKTLPDTNTTLDVYQAGGNPAAAEAYKRYTMGAGPHYNTYQNLNNFQKYLHRTNQVLDPVKRLGAKLVGQKSPEKYDGRYGGKPTFNKNFVTLGGSRNTDIMAHELGHAVDFATPGAKWKRAIGGVGRRVHGIPSAALGGLALTNEKTRDYAWTVPVVAALPTLREEAAANVNAAKLVSKAGGDAKLLRGLFARNMTSYTVPVVLSAGALAGIAALRRKGEEVNPEEWLSEKE